MQATEQRHAVNRGDIRSAYRVEVAICAVLIAIFIFMFIDSLDWSLEAALFPRIVSGFGMVTVLAYALQLTWQRMQNRDQEKRRILDIPWAKVAGDQIRLKKQALGIIAWAVAFWVAVVFVGFHVAAPLYLFSQLVIYGEVKPWIAAVGGGICLLLIDLIYDRLAGTTWNDPILFDLVKSIF